ncbi:hypothetical protein Pfo_002123 [Paulownia fortunei]|nr:hypothetical protein Pfo_002123 [Paulownia fortunei]
MPLGKYYCDYCDKQFQDTPASRRRHLQGVAHQRAKALWYDAVRSSSQFGLNQAQDPLSMGKGVCNRFVRTGSCQYGDSCKYYHPKKNVPNMNTQGMQGTSFVNNIQSRVFLIVFCMEKLLCLATLLWQLYFLEIKWEHHWETYLHHCGLLQRVDIYPYPSSIGDRCATSFRLGSSSIIYCSSCFYFTVLFVIYYNEKFLVPEIHYYTP